MKTKHLTDEVVQDYVVHKISDEQFALHIMECGDCNAKIEAYQVLVNTINSIKPETFSFDITALVLQKIEATESKRNALCSYALITILNIFILSVILFSVSILEPITQAFHSLKLIDNAFIIVSALSVFIFLIKDLLRQYKQKEMLFLQ